MNACRQYFTVWREGKEIHLYMQSHRNIVFFYCTTVNADDMTVTLPILLLTTTVISISMATIVTILMI